MKWGWIPIGCLVAACSPPAEDDGTASETDAAVELGPGLGNQSWSEEELFRPVGWVDRDNGVPEPLPDVPITAIKPFGTNVAYMHGGYMITLTAPDSGFGPGGLLFYDVSDPTDPVLVNRVFEPDGRTKNFREAHAMAFAHIDGQEIVALHTGLGVEFWDIQDVYAPERVGEIDLPGVNFGDYDGVAWQLAWQGDTVYVGGSSQGVFLVDATDPSAPSLVTRVSGANPVPPSELGGFRVGPLFVLGNTLIVSSMDNEAGYAVLDLSHPHQPALIGQRGDLDKFYSVCFADGRVITSGRGAGAVMTVDDVSDPWNLRWVSRDLQMDHQLYCAAQDNFVFQGGEREVAKIDVSDPSAPEIVGRGSLDRPLTDHGQVTPFGNMVFVGNDHGTGSAFVPHQREPDTKGPAVSFVSPANGATSQTVSTRIGLGFTDAVDAHSLGRSNLTVTDEQGQAVEGRITVQGTLVNFAPAEPLKVDTTYSVSVVAGGVTDWVGNPVEEAFHSSFRTVSQARSEGDGLWDVGIAHTGPVRTGEAVTLSLTGVEGLEGEVAWREASADRWTAPIELDAPFAKAFDEPGHYSFTARITDGVHQVIRSARVTVHRPLLPNRPTSSNTLALDATSNHLWVANRDHGSVSRLTADDLVLVDAYDVCQTPHAVALDAEGQLWVSCEGDDRVVVLSPHDGAVVGWVNLPPGSAPRGLVVDDLEDRVYVALMGSGQLAAIGKHAIALHHTVDLGPTPSGIALNPVEKELYITRFLTSGDAAHVYVVDVSDDENNRVTVQTIAADTRTVDAEDRARGVPNYLNRVAASPDGARLWFPAKLDNIYRGGFVDGQDLTHETTVRSIVAQLRQPGGERVFGPWIDFNDRAHPVDAAFSPLGDYIFLAMQGSDRVMVLDAYKGTTVGERTGDGKAVESLLVSPDGTRLYAHHFLSRDVSLHDVSGFATGEDLTMPRLARGSAVTAEVLAPEVLKGKQIFYNASDPRMSKDGYISCASCHLDGGHDGQVWDFTDRGEGLRNTIDLRGRGGMAHGPLHWTGNFDEVQDFENDIRHAFGGAGFLTDSEFETGTRSDPLGDPKAGVNEDLDALAAYVASLTEVPQPTVVAGQREDWDKALVLGEQLFVTAGCDDCHSGSEYTASELEALYDVGTLTAASGSRRGGPLLGLDIPTLRGVDSTPPYLHDGSAETLEEVFLTAPLGGAHDALGPLDAQGFAALILYLRSLD